MTPKLMVDYCRQIIERWPKSVYAFQAKRMLADIPERYKKMYNVTEKEMDVSSFYQ
jgi:outer membrane protein assembly factor BamD (BamD/ComL family)